MNILDRLSQIPFILFICVSRSRISSPPQFHFVLQLDPLLALHALANLLRSVGLRVQLFGSAPEFLQSKLADVPSCLILDIRLPRVSGLDFQADLAEAGIHIPIIFMTGHGDIPMTVRAMKAGAVDFIEKPFEKDTLFSSLDEGFRRLSQEQVTGERRRDAKVKLQALTARELDVLDGLAQGMPNKTIAYDLGISPRTVEIHRANLMTKLGARSLSEALRIAFAAGDG